MQYCVHNYAQNSNGNAKKLEKYIKLVCIDWGQKVHILHHYFLNNV